MVFRCDTTLDAELEKQRHGVESDIAQDAHAAVTQRTLELEQARELLRARTRDLRQEIVERERAERAKDEIVTIVNHELRTPLTSVRGFAELIRERDLPRETQVRYAGIMCAETERLTELLNNFLDIQRIGSEAHTYVFEPMDVGILLQEVADVFSCGSHSIEVSVAPDLPMVRADRQRMHQAVANLIANGIKFSPGAPSVFVGASVEGDGVAISVRDEGVGIPEDKVQHLFQMFYRVDNEATRSIGGTGLGLALVKRIVDGHGGRVSVESALAKGTVFRVVLPFNPAKGNRA
jgi:signal transduction histidine kinase